MGKITEIIEQLEKAKKYPIGTVRQTKTGKWKKISDTEWREVGKVKEVPMRSGPAIMNESGFKLDDLREKGQHLSDFSKEERPVKGKVVETLKGEKEKNNKTTIYEVNDPKTKETKGYSYDLTQLSGTSSDGYFWKNLNDARKAAKLELKYRD